MGFEVKPPQGATYRSHGRKPVDRRHPFPQAPAGGDTPAKGKGVIHGLHGLTRIRDKAKGNSHMDL